MGRLSRLGSGEDYIGPLMFAEHDNCKPERVLIVRPSALGDVCRTVPALVTLRAALPTARIDWLVHDGYADAVRHHPALNEVVTFPRQQLGRTLRTGRAAGAAMHWLGDLRRRKYDLVIDLQGLFRSGLVTRLSGAERRVGFANARELAWLGYNCRYPIDRSHHTVDRMLALLEAVGYEPKRDMRLFVAPADYQWLDRWLEHEGAANEPYACLAPTAKWRCKCWPMDKYTQVARRLLETQVAGRRLVVVAAPEERDQVRPLREAFRSAKSSVLFPHTTVGQLMALLSRTSLLLGNDSASLHIAVGFDRPIVALFGPTDPSTVGPYQRSETVVQAVRRKGPDLRNYRAHRDDQSLIAQVCVQRVWNKVMEQVQNHVHLCRD